MENFPTKTLHVNGFQNDDFKKEVDVFVTLALSKGLSEVIFYNRPSLFYKQIGNSIHALISRPLFIGIFKFHYLWELTGEKVRSMFVVDNEVYFTSLQSNSFESFFNLVVYHLTEGGEAQ